jgi:hypothetical protein
LWQSNIPFVIPAKAGIQGKICHCGSAWADWIPDLASLVRHDKN